MTPHTPWCGLGHLCNLGEHRADPIDLDVTAGAAGVLTQVRDQAEIRLRLRLDPAEAGTRRQLAAMLT